MTLGPNAHVLMDRQVGEFAVFDLRPHGSSGLFDVFQVPVSALGVVGYYCFLCFSVSPWA